MASHTWLSAEPAQHHWKPLTNRCASGRTSITWHWITCVHKASWRTTKHLWYANTNAYMQSHKVQWIHTWIQLSSQELYTLQHMSKESLLVIPLPGVQRLLHSVARAVGDICLLTPLKSAQENYVMQLMPPTYSVVCHDTTTSPLQQFSKGLHDLLNCFQVLRVARQWDVRSSSLTRRIAAILLTGLSQPHPIQ